MLHLVQTRIGLTKCKNLVKPGDTVVFMGEGVLAAKAITNCKCFAIADEAKRVGLQLDENVMPCSHERLLALVVENDSSVSWR